MDFFRDRRTSSAMAPRVSVALKLAPGVGSPLGVAAGALPKVVGSTCRRNPAPCSLEIGVRMFLPVHDRSDGERPGDEHSDLFIVAKIYLFALVAAIVVLVIQQANWAAGLDHGDWAARSINEDGQA